MPQGVVWIPQKPYLPQTTLREALYYPGLGTEDTAEIEALLDQVGLSYLAPRLRETGAWNALLSGGELARLALVRALLQRPRWILMDEPTAALDAQSAQLFWSLVEREAKLGVVLIAHALEPPYDRWRRVELAREGFHRRPGGDASSAGA
jgi:putative ATP-binding cassette transporter